LTPAASCPDAALDLVDAERRGAERDIHAVEPGLQRWRLRALHPRAKAFVPLFVLQVDQQAADFVHVGDGCGGGLHDHRTPTSTAMATT